MFAGYARAPECITARKSGVLDQPCGRNLVILLQRRMAGNREFLFCGSFLQRVVLLFGQHRILEERSSAPAVGIAFHDQHALARSNATNGFADLRETWRAVASVEIAFQVVVFNVWLAAGCERIGHVHDNEPSALARVEDARAIGKSASLVAKLANLLLLEIKHLHRLDCFRNLLPVSAHILHGSSAHTAGYPAQTLHSRAADSNRFRDEPIPQLTRPNMENCLAVAIAGIRIDPGDAYFED